MLRKFVITFISCSVGVIFVFHLFPFFIELILVRFDSITNFCIDCSKINDFDEHDAENYHLSIPHSHVYLWLRNSFLKFSFTYRDYEYLIFVLIKALHSLSQTIRIRSLIMTEDSDTIAQVHTPSLTQ
jgi:hypothetical protein